MSDEGKLRLTDPVQARRLAQVKRRLLELKEELRVIVLDAPFSDALAMHQILNLTELTEARLKEVITERGS